LLVLRIQIIFNALKTVALHSFLELSGPVDLTAVENALAGMAQDPIISRLLLIVDDREFEHIPHRGDHHLLDVSHPEFDVAVPRVNLLNEIDLLSLA